MAEAKKDPNSPEFKAKCAELWRDTKGTVVHDFRKNIRPHPKSVFLGYADITLSFQLASGNVWLQRIRGCDIKIVNGKPNLGMPSEKSKSSDDYFPITFPFGEIGHEQRDVLTARVFADSRIEAAVQEAADMVAASSAGEGAEDAGAGAGTPNPYEDA